MLKECAHQLPPNSLTPAVTLSLICICPSTFFGLVIHCKQKMMMVESSSWDVSLTEPAGPLPAFFSPLI